MIATHIAKVGGKIQLEKNKHTGKCWFSTSCQPGLVTQSTARGGDSLACPCHSTEAAGTRSCQVPQTLFPHNIWS